MSRRRVLLEENQHTRFFWAELILCELLIEFATSACVALRVRVGRCVCVLGVCVCVCVYACIVSDHRRERARGHSIRTGSRDGQYSGQVTSVRSEDGPRR